MLSSRTRLFLLMALAAMICVGSPVGAQARPFLFSCGRYKASWAGRPWSYDQQCWDLMTAIGVTMTGCQAAWCDVEPSPGQYDWAYADFEVDQILARGMEPFMFLGLTPDWAKLYPDLPPHRTPPREDCVDEFMNFHRMVAERYRGRVKYYTFWNEPNGCSWINDGCSNSDGYPLYTQWLIRCSQAIKEGDPDAKIIAGNLDYNVGAPHVWQYVQGMYDCGAGPYIDGIAIHPYDWGGTIYWQAIEDTRAVMVANGDADKGIWITEYGWNWGSEQDLADKLTYVLTELKKPEWSYVVMAEYLVLNDGSGVENYGLMDANLNPRLRYYAFRDVDKTWPDTVDFSADVTSGPAPLTVHFTDESSVDGAYQWYWLFGDGQASYEQNPTHVYTEDGSYTVTLRVTGTNGAFTEEKADYIRVGVFPPTPGVDNPSFEEGGGSYDGWEIVRISGEGPDNPPLDNTNPFGPRTPYGDHFGGKVTNGMWMDFYLGQVVGVSDWDPDANAADWQMTVYVQICSTHENEPNPSGVHQVWEIGWNDDGSEPTSITACDHYQVIADIDGGYTGNDNVGFYQLSASGTIAGVRGLRGVAVRVHMYNDANWWWTWDNIDNLSFVASSVPGVQTPAGFYKPGWNLTSVPVEPAEAEASSVFADLVDLGNVLDGNLYGYDPATGYSVYPSDFSDIERGRGYWLYLSNAPADAVVSVCGQTADGDVSLPLSEGWNLIGHPFPEAVWWPGCRVSDGATSKTIPDAVAAGWMQGRIYFYDDGAYGTCDIDGVGDDYALRPWRGYWILIYQPGLSLIVPAP